MSEPDFYALHTDGKHLTPPSLPLAKQWLADQEGCPVDHLHLTDRSSSGGIVEEYEVTRTDDAGAEVHVGTISREWIEVHGREP